MKQTRRLANLPPYPFARWSRHIEDARRRGLDPIRLDIGDPDMPPADEVVDALCQSARQPGHHGYPGYRGLAALRAAMAEYYQRRFGVTLDPDTQVLPLIGSKEGIVNMALACMDPGDVALVPELGYAPYAMGAALAGADAYTFPLPAARGYLPDLAAIPGEVASQASLLWLNYPNNPTGATADLAFLSQAVAFARQHGLILCHDAPYCDVTYDGYVAPSALQVEGALDVTVEFNSLSKTANMAGWRVGMAVGNSEALAALAQVKSNVDSGIFRPLQEAAVRALAVSPEWIAVRNRVYQARMEILLEALHAAGMAVSRPRATLYAWAQVPPGWQSEPFAMALLKQTGVVLAPGPFFGPGGEGFVRLSVTTPTDRLCEAMDRLVRFATSASPAAQGTEG
ncbi:MAG: aminotransferase class I/II-fold pyridoxal phosphate-dependent enzyme [Anaerolineales bacterium]|nr:aminotransferase class I/II-fold pyridoxal phosphate-dependent enzyme [Anaerolineales bacterium]